MGNLKTNANPDSIILIDVHLLSKKEIKSPGGRQPIFINALKTGIHV